MRERAPCRCRCERGERERGERRQAGAGMVRRENGCMAGRQAVRELQR